MSSNLPSSLKNLRSSAVRLNEITNKANETVRLVENFLSQECSIGTYAWVEVKQEHHEETGTTNFQYLEYRKVGPRFRIAVVWSDGSPESESVTPWSDCSREIKLETIKKLPNLLDSLTENIDEMVGEAEEVTESVTKAVHALIGKGA